jgi:Ca2+-transporting ATPase
VLFIPELNSLFKLAVMDLHHWEIVIMLIFIPIPLVETMKLFKLNGKD